MIKVKDIEIFGWEAAIRGMRNPMNSWNKSNSEYRYYFDFENNINYTSDEYFLGSNDLELMKKLVTSGTDHSKFMRMIHVQMDIIAPLYWWKEFDTYKVGTVANSCSTMHKIHDKEFTLDDFSHEHLIILSSDNCFTGNMFDMTTPFDNLKQTVEMLNVARDHFLKTKDKKYWWQMIQLLPSSYNQKRTVDLNYEVLRNMYFARKNHKLDEWREFCNIMIDNLPYFKQLILDKED